MTQKFFVDAQGNYLGSYDGPPSENPFSNAIEVSNPPSIATQKWTGSAWSAPPAPTSYQLSKAAVWRRMTSAEAAAMDAVMQETDAQIKQIYMAAQYLSTDDDLWGVLKTILTTAFNAQRADELLAPEV